MFPSIRSNFRSAASSTIHQLRELALSLERENAVLQVIWLPRDLLEAEDALSREAEDSIVECTLPAQTKLLLTALPPHSVDVFASATMHLFDRYVSRFPDHKSFAVDGLAFLSSVATSVSLFLFPPFGLASLTLVKLISLQPRQFIAVLPRDTLRNADLPLHWQSFRIPDFVCPPPYTTTVGSPRKLVMITSGVLLSSLALQCTTPLG